MNMRSFISAAVIAVLLGACASAPEPDPRVLRLQAEYEDLISNPDLAPRGGDELEQARTALRRLTDPTIDYDEAEYELALYRADRLIELAEYAARARLADELREQLSHERKELVLKARTREVERAERQAVQARIEAAAAVELKNKALDEAARAEAARKAAEQAQVDAEAARVLAEQKQQRAREAANSAMSAAKRARLEAEAEAAKAEQARLAAAAAEAEAAQARAEAASARAERERLESRLTELETRETDRGLVITLGDVLFEFDKAELKAGAARNLQPLVDFLREQPEQVVIVEGHTDSVGTREYNLELSKRRADAVQDFLAGAGIDPTRIEIRGYGPDLPVATNDTPEGRQLNRRVEVILPETEQVSLSAQ